MAMSRLRFALFSLAYFAQLTSHSVAKAEVPWTLQLLPLTGSCVPDPEHNPLQGKLSLEVHGDFEAWRREHEADEVCLEYGGAMGRGGRVCSKLMDQGGELILPKTGAVEGEVGDFEVLATVLDGRGEQVSKARATSKASRNGGVLPKYRINGTRRCC